MGGDRYDATLALRLPFDLRSRLEVIAQREMRTLSKVTVRAIELGLDIMEAGSGLGDTAQLRGEAFERAVLAVLMTHGVLPRTFEAGEKPTKRVEMRSKKIGKKKVVS